MSHSALAALPPGLASDRSAQLEQLVLQCHVRLRLQTDTSTEDVSQSTSLLSKGVDDRCSWWSQRSLKHVAKNAKHAVETLVLLRGCTVIGPSFPRDTSHHFRNEHEVYDEWRSQ
jgi:hypothetical protein